MNRVPASVWRNPIHFLAFGLGSGASPWAPGTVGTLAAIPLWYLLMMAPLPLYLVLVAIAFVIGCWLCDRTSSDIGVHDHGGIVWDEFVGFWVTMIAIPAEPVWVVAGFVLFRLFDIIKPWPIRWADKKVHGGLGIMLDDLIAGGFAWVLLYCAYRIWGG
ncbi:MAG: phosphatidylglycerophosphatase A [Oceanospirillaceae bacterium]|uniref:phosphatidylglycerophosphatase A family protein n=1 Tax=Marinobacterium litorale TaxID=404770 RepID=UPI000420B6DF|nr:phosphatidylglycerophosphatase A [Marinobacterium litorale]MBS98761.1 phosphatidylglycerophosphatase A [Oceanospirillaceae bacterium]